MCDILEKEYPAVFSFREMLLNYTYVNCCKYWMLDLYIMWWFCLCKQCQEHRLHMEHLDEIHELVIPKINDNIYCRSCGHVFRINQNKHYQCMLCDDGYILCLKCHNDGMHQNYSHYHELKIKKAYIVIKYFIQTLLQ